VTLAEEMPFSESVEYVQSLREKTPLHFGPMFVNAVMPPLPKIPFPKNLPGNLEIYADYYRLAHERGELNAGYLRKIADAFTDFTRIVLPFQFGGLNTLADFKPLIAHVIGDDK
jgi:hypothetical protein